MQKMVGRSRIPGVPRVGDKETSDKLDTVQTRASQTSQAFIHGRRLEVIPLKHARDSSRSVQSRGSRRSRDSGSGSSRSRTLYGEGRGSRDLDDGSGTCSL
mgnify:CR=1 FL=1